MPGLFDQREATKKERKKERMLYVHMYLFTYLLMCSSFIYPFIILLIYQFFI